MSSALLLFHFGSAQKAGEWPRAHISHSHVKDNKPSLQEVICKKVRGDKWIKIFFFPRSELHTVETAVIYYFVAEIELPALSRQYLDNPQER